MSLKLRQTGRCIHEYTTSGSGSVLPLPLPLAFACGSGALAPAREPRALPGLWFKRTGTPPNRITAGARETGSCVIDGSCSRERREQHGQQQKQQRQHEQRHAAATAAERAHAATVRAGTAAARANGDILRLLSARVPTPVQGKQLELACLGPSSGPSLSTCA
jgi:hypothetical protein